VADALASMIEAHAETLPKPERAAHLDQVIAGLARGRRDAAAKGSAATWS
jgi:hypothetical protein